MVLGRLSATQLLDGRMAVRRDLAEQAIAGLAAQLGASVVETARGIVSVVQTNMLGAIRVVSVRKGYDPRGYTLVAFGGAGPLHAAALARDLGIQRVLIPPAPGILCALGLLVAPLRLDLVRTRVALLDTLTAAELAQGFEDLEQQAAIWLDKEGVAPDQRRLARAFDMRYVGQNFELTVEAGGRSVAGREDVARRLPARARARLRLRRARRAGADRGAAPHGVRRPRAAP